MYQCADTTTMARGRGRLSPRVRHDAVYVLSDRAFIGLPWPRKAAGIFSAVVMFFSRFVAQCYVVHTP
jgi:hypothetical protein